MTSLFRRFSPLVAGLALLLPSSIHAQAGAGQPVLAAPPPQQRPPTSVPGTSAAGAPATGVSTTTRTSLVTSGISPASSPNYRLSPDDVIQITVWKEPSLSGSFPIRPDGMISLVLLGDVHAAGMTPMELGDQLTERLKKYIQDPLVAVSVMAANSQKIYVLGEVQHVGAVEMAASMTPLQAISAAGGLTPYAKSKNVYILRGPAGKQRKIPFNYKKALKGDPNSSLVLQAGDTIVVP